MRTAPWALLLVFFSCRHSELVEIAPKHNGAPLAVIVSGDGGWRAIDRDIAAGLHERGYAVVGLNASAYFATRRSPEQASQELRDIIITHAHEWASPRVIAIGYSRGAGVLPFMINRLPADVRSSISLVALIGLDRTIDFYVTPFDLLRRRPTEAEIPVRAEVEKLRDMKVLCIYGARDTDNACSELPNVVQLREPGGHHMNVSYDALARTIWSASRAAYAAAPHCSISRTTSPSDNSLLRAQKSSGNVRPTRRSIS